MEHHNNKDKAGSESCLCQAELMGPPSLMDGCLSGSGDWKNDSCGRAGYWLIVWGQFRRKKWALTGLVFIFMLFLTASYAPFLSLNKPILVIDGHSLQLPFFTALFDRNLFSSGVDIFFNLQIFLFPLGLLSFILHYFLSRESFCAGFVSHLACYVLFSLFAFVMFLVFPRYEQYVDWRQDIFVKKQSGRAISVVWPLRHFSYREINTDSAHPSPPGREHFLGTDKEGRDVFARMIYGTRVSLTIGLIAVSIYVGIGVLLGSLAGFFGGRTDLFLSRLIEIMMCFPAFFLILTLSALFEARSIFHVMLIIGLTSWPGVARLVRAEFLKNKNLDYVAAARALGFSRARIIFGHILPNSLGPVIVTSVFGIAAAILVESSLSFLGLGDPGLPSWGETLSQGRQELKSWLILAPGFAIFMVVSVFNLVGEGLQDAMDPKLRR
jgi:peptide/nickel transport system permease protein